VLLTVYCVVFGGVNSLWSGPAGRNEIQPLLCNKNIRLKINVGNAAVSVLYYIIAYINTDFKIGRFYGEFSSPSDIKHVPDFGYYFVARQSMWQRTLEDILYEVAVIYFHLLPQIIFLFFLRCLFKLCPCLGFYTSPVFGFFQSFVRIYSFLLHCDRRWRHYIVRNVRSNKILADNSLYEAVDEEYTFSFETELPNPL
jgi:hypothetical protein